MNAEELDELLLHAHEHGEVIMYAPPDGWELVKEGDDYSSCLSKDALETTMRKLDRNAMVLLSGGLDSTAALHLAREQYQDVAAVAFRYGQPHGIEVVVAQQIAFKRGVPFQILAIAEAVRGLDTLIPAPAGLSRPGVSRAVLPGRNLILMSCAAAHAARRWPGGRFDVVIGANIDDGRGFADCRIGFIHRASDAVALSLKGQAEGGVRAPWVEMCFTKAQIVEWSKTRPDALEDIRNSLSCYAGTRCGKCDACTLRASAFADAGVDDGTFVPGLSA